MRESHYSRTRESITPGAGRALLPEPGERGAGKEGKVESRKWMVDEERGLGA
jgi:hypothetical protein